MIVQSDLQTPRGLMRGLIFIMCLTFSGISYGVESCQSLFSQNETSLYKSENSILRTSAFSRDAGNFPANHQIYDFGVLIFRSDANGVSLPTAWQTQSLLPHWGQQNIRMSADKNETLGLNKNSLKKLYDSYSKQGSERNTQIELFAEEDLKTFDRTTHFILSSEGEALAHIQAQASLSEKDLVNLENHFPESIPFVRDTKKYPVFELGRFIILKAKDMNLESNKNKLSSQSHRDFAFLSIWLPLTNWLIHQNTKSTVVFQVNESVLQHLKKKFSPVSLDHRIPVQLGPDFPIEWIVKLKIADIKKIRNILSTEKLKYSLANFLKSRDEDLILSLEPDDVEFYEALNIYKLSGGYVAQNAANQLKVFGYNVSPGIFETGQANYNSELAKTWRTKTHSVRLGREQAQIILDSLLPD